MSLVFGYIFEWGGFDRDSGTELNSKRFREQLLSIKAFRPFKERAIQRAPRWAAYRFHSPRPLLGEEPDALNIGSDYPYNVYVRVNEKTGTLVVAGARYTVTEEAVRTFNTYVRPSLQRKVINIKSLCEHLFEREIENHFAVTYLSADVPGHGTALTSITLVGDDIAAADFLTEERMTFTARQVGVRPTDHRTECGRFGSVGSIQFRTDLVDNFERFLVYAYNCGLYID